jgi:hypothetical protein
MMGNGWIIKERDMECKSGRMGGSIRDNGGKT